jgi:hypothetical protein
MGVDFWVVRKKKEEVVLQLENFNVEGRTALKSF